MKKDFLKMSDLTKDELLSLIELAEKLKFENKNGIPHEILKGKTLGMIFEKSSTRTRVSFEVGIYQLGGQGLFLSSKDTQLGRGEPIKDTARVLSRYMDGIMIRTFGQEIVEELAKYSSIPVINALTDYAHPCQVLADLLTIKEHKGSFENRKMCYIGDGNNMANSLIVGGLLSGMDVAVATPDDYRPHPEVLEFAKAYGSKFVLTNNIFEAAEYADAVFTDVWSSMGMEAEIEKRISAAKWEFTQSVKYNDIVVNDDLEECVVKVLDLMNKYQIGVNAGIIWHLLNDNNRWTYCELKNASGLSDRDLNAAIGWLAREDKIDFDENQLDNDCFFLSVNIFIG